MGDLPRRAGRRDSRVEEPLHGRARDRRRAPAASQGDPARCRRSRRHDDPRRDRGVRGWRSESAHAPRHGTHRPGGWTRHRRLSSERIPSSGSSSQPSRRVSRRGRRRRTRYVTHCWRPPFGRICRSASPCATSQSVGMGATSLPSAAVVCSGSGTFRHTACSPSAASVPTGDLLHSSRHGRRVRARGAARRDNAGRARNVHVRLFTGCRRRRGRVVSSCSGRGTSSRRARAEGARRSRAFYPECPCVVASADGTRVAFVVGRRADIAALPGNRVVARIRHPTRIVSLAMDESGKRDCHRGGRLGGRKTLGRHERHARA